MFFQLRSGFRVFRLGKQVRFCGKYLPAALEVFVEVNRIEERNKAGYTAISCGRVGRGGNATVRDYKCFKTLISSLFDSCPRTDRPTDRRTDKASYRVACPQLKIESVKTHDDQNVSEHDQEDVI